jgi:hypothetical protein
MQTKRHSRIKLNQEVLPAEWPELISEYGFRWSKRSTLDFVQWKEVRGKGYQIWISIPKPNRVKSITYWECAIDTTKHLPKEGFELLEYLISNLEINFPMIEINRANSQNTY